MSKLVEANEKLAQKVVEGYKKIENGVVGGYKAMAFGIVGMGMALSNYPICKKLLAGRRKKYAGQILELSEKIMKG